MKKWLVLLAALMLSASLAACGSSQGGEGSAHPYSFQEKGNGSVRVTLQNAPEAGYSWAFAGTEDGLLQVERLDGGKGSKATFSVTGQDFASGTVSFSCRRDSAPYDTSFQLNLSLGTTEKGTLQVLEANYVERPAGGAAGQEGKASCTWYTTEDSQCALYVDSLEGDWSLMGYDSTILSVDGPSYGEEGCTYSLTGLAAGDTQLFLYDLTEGYGFRLSVTVTEELAVSVSDGEAGALEIPTTEIPGMSEVTALVGELTLGDGVELLESRVGSWWGGETEDYAYLELRGDGGKWGLMVTKSYSVEELIGLCFGDGEGVTQTGTTVGGFSGTLCEVEENQMLLWADQQGRAFALYALSGDTQKNLMEMARKLTQTTTQKEGA